MEMMKGLGLEPNPGVHLEGWLKDAGFEDVKVKKIPLPVGTWPADKRLVRGRPLSLDIYET